MRLNLLALICLVASGCQSSKVIGVKANGDSGPTPVRFTEISKEVGIDFVHVNGARGRKLMPETVGSGTAFFDFDNDGKLDILIVNGCTWPGDPKPIRSTTKLYRNLGSSKFEDVTEKSGLAQSFYGMGVSVGDYDSDGWEDLYLTAVGPNHLYHNESGKFREVTQTAGVVGVPLAGTKMEHKWSSTSAWLDYDRDGKLDLFVCQYVKWSPEIDPFCGHAGIRGYCPPGNFEGARCTLFHNQGNGTFRDVSKEVGLFDGAVGKSFGIAVADYNKDGWPDLAVSNDTWANFLFINQDGKRFAEKGVESGIAFAESGKARAGMGIDVADFRNNGKFSLVIGNFADEGLSLFEPLGDQGEMFEDSAQRMGVTAPSLLNVTFGAFFFDFDLDGWQDILATNGHVDDIVNTYNSALTFEQKPLLLRNEAGQRFSSVGETSGLDLKIVGRGAAYGDIDDDGDLDIGIVNNTGRFLLFRNDGGNQNHWIRIKLKGQQSNSEGIGSQVSVRTKSATQQQLLKSGGGFLSENERALTFGLGSQETVDTIEVRWPSGTKDELRNVAANKTYKVVEGKGLE